MRPHVLATLAALFALLSLPGVARAQQRIVGSAGSKDGTQARLVSTFRIERDKHSTALLVRCKIFGKNGQMDVRMALDTGCSYVLLAKIVGDALGLAHVPLPGSAVKSAVASSPQAKSDDPVLLDRMLIDNTVRFDELYPYLWDTKAIRSLGEEQVDGILGLYPFAFSSLLIDVQKGEGTAFYPSALTAAEMKAAGMDGAVELPVEIENYVVSVTVTFAGGQKEKLYLDTGAVHTGITAKTAKELGLTPVSRWTGFTLYGQVKFAQAKLPSMALGPLQLNDVLIEYPDKKQLEMPGHLGMDILSRYRILLDQPNKKLFLKALPPPAPAP